MAFGKKEVNVNMQTPEEPTPSASARALATLSMGLVSISALCLGALHLLSSELDPSWHMVSEYAYGNHGALLCVFFLSWGLGAIALGLATIAWADRWRHRLGVCLVIVSGFGAVGGGLFDVRHALHGLAFGIGVPTLPIGALLLNGLLSKHAPAARQRLRVLAHATWICILIMAVTMVLFIASLKAAGAFHPESGQALKSLPHGVTSVSGYANRLLVMVYLTWIGVAAGAIRTISKVPR